MLKPSVFDLSRLFLAVDAQRRDDGLSWAALARQVGVSPATMKRFATATDAEADGVLALVRWLGVVPESFTEGTDLAGEPLPQSGVGIVRTIGKRTTIQRLLAAAQHEGVSVASLTRLSDT